MQCSKCHFDNPAGMKFCGQCGTRLARVCPRCASQSPPNFKFCGECGALLEPESSADDGTPSPQAQPAQLQVRAAAAASTATAGPQDERSRAAEEGEIKQVTVLCGELSFEPADGLESELVHRLLNRFFELTREEVERYGGSVNQLFDRGFTALFGAPVAYEDHARRALLAACDLRDRVADRAAEFEALHGARWRTGMGLDSGAVVFGGSGDTAVGEAITGARQLGSRAEPGTTLIATDTARLVRSFVDLESVTRAAGDGGWNGDVWRLRGLRSELAVAGSGKTRSRFVGRDRELGLLDELRARAEQGEGQLVAIAGEAGAGKSRLLYELHKKLRGRSVTYLRGQCLSFGTGIPYLPLIDIIRRAARIVESDDFATVVDKLRSSLEWMGPDLKEELPYLLRLLGAETDPTALADLEPQTIQNRTFAALRRILLDASQAALVVVEIEDMHWIDETSERFLDSLVERMSATRLLLLLTYRSGDSPRWLEKSYATQITMRRLSTDESQRLVDAVLERAVRSIDQRRKARIPELLQKAEGNPLFLEELAHSLTGDSENRELAIPETVQGILMARIDRLPEAHKQLLRTAAVFGRSFPLELLRSLWTRPEPVEPLLEDLCRWEFLYQAPSEENHHFFKHALTQEVAYESLLSHRRRKLHRLVAETLESLYADRLEDAYGRLIYHYPRAGEPEKTVYYLTLFASRAARVNAHSEAAKVLREALEHAERLPPETRNRRLVEVLLQLAGSLLPLARFPETLDLCLRYQRHVAELDEVGLNAQYQFWLAHTYTYLGDQEATRRHAQLAISAAQDCGDEITEGKACYVLGRNGFWSGQFAEGIEYSLRAVVLLERSGEPWWQGQAYWVAGFNHYVLGEIENGLEALERAYEIGEALDDYRLDTSWSQGYFYASLGDWETGIEKCRSGLERAQDPLNSAVATGFLGYAQLQKKDFEQAAATLNDSVDRLQETGMQQILGWFTAFLAEARLARGEVEKAHTLAMSALSITRESGFLYGVALAQRTLGLVELAAGRFDRAKERFDEALGSFTSLAVPFQIGRTRLECARLAHCLRDRAAARHELLEAVQLFERLRVSAYVERARELAGELGVSVAD